MEGSGNCETDDLKRQRNWDQIKVPGLRPSMSMSDLMNHIGNHISGQMTSGNPVLSEGGVECQDILEDIAEYLLSDSQFTAASDEKSLMSRVNSLCCLLQKDPGSVQNLQLNGESCFEGLDEKKDVQLNLTSESSHENKATSDITAPPEGDTKDATGYKQQAPAMSRKDSFGDLLLHLPRITSLPKFLFNISEDDENQAR